MSVDAPTMSAQAAKPAEGPCRERHVLSVVMENKPSSHGVADGGLRAHPVFFFLANTHICHFAQGVFLRAPVRQAGATSADDTEAVPMGSNLIDHVRRSR